MSALLDEAFATFGLPAARPASPRVQHEFDPGRVLRASVVTSDFARHLSRSRNPGVDLDVPGPRGATERLPISDKPTVRSYGEGVTADVSPNRFGTVRVLDRNGYEHQYTHMHLRTEEPLSERTSPWPGARVEPGAPLGRLGDVRADADHLHYSIRDPEGYFVDPQNALFDDRGNVIGVRDPEQREINRAVQRMHRQVERELGERRSRPTRHEYDNVWERGRGTNVA